MRTLIQRISWIFSALLLLSAATGRCAPVETSGGIPEASLEMPTVDAPLNAGFSVSQDLDQTLGPTDVKLGAAPESGIAPEQAITAAPEIQIQAATPQISQGLENPKKSSVQKTAASNASDQNGPGAADELKSLSAGIENNKPGSEYDSALGLYDGGHKNISGQEEDDVSPADDLHVYFNHEEKEGLKKSSKFTSIRLMDTKGREWHWNKFNAGVKIYVHAGNSTLFASRVQQAQTKAISQLTRADLEGFYPQSYLRSRPIGNIRKRLIKDLEQKAAKPVTKDSQVRVVRFVPFKNAQEEIQENKDEQSFGAMVPRRSYEIPRELGMASKFLPKAVILDLNLFPDGVPSELVEDMNKLMNAGVYFVLVTNKPLNGPGSAEEILTKRLSLKQKSKLHRYKLLTLADEGNALASYDGNFVRLTSMPRFDRAQMEVMTLAAHGLGVFKAEFERPDAFAISVPEGENPETFAASYAAALRRVGLPEGAYRLRVMAGRQGPVVVLRPLDMINAFPVLLTKLRENQQLYINPSDVMLISRDSRLLDALPGAIAPANMSAAASLKGEELADMSLAALVPEYRTNKPGDLAVSASMVSSFLKKEKFESGKRETPEMFLGHVIHSAFNWAFWRYRNDGVFPDAEAVMAQAKIIWENDTKMIKLTTGNLASAYENLDRVLDLHAYIADRVKKFPIFLGTELPNIFVAQRYGKKGEPTYRDIFRTVYDAVLARETPEGLEVAVIDIKTGKDPTNQHLDKDFQAQLYDWVSRHAWKKISPVYGNLQNLKPVTNVFTYFAYHTGMKEPALNEWTRMRFEKHIKGVLVRIRKAWDIVIPDGGTAKPRKAGAENTAGALKSKKTAAKARSDKAVASEPGFETLVLPETVPGIKIKKQYAQQIIKGTKKIEYRSRPTVPKPFVAIIQTFTDEEPGRAAEVVGFARIEKVTQGKNEIYEYHLSHVTPVKPYVAPSRPGAVIWLKDIPVQGAKRLNSRS